MNLNFKCIYLKSSEDLNSLMKRVNASINSFTRALDLKPEDNTLWIENGFYLYQMNSYFGRCLRMVNLSSIFLD
jgi:hypothetical protein